MTVSAVSPVSFNSYFDTASGRVKQAALYFYRAGTLDPITVYTDNLLSIPHPVPVLTTGNGRVPPVWVGTMAAPGYRFRAFDQYSQLLEDVDNLPGAIDPLAGVVIPPAPDPTALHQVGDVIPSFSNATPRAGCVRCNGGTIGSSAGTERGNPDCHALFVWLWGQDLYGLLPVTPSRGASAEGDWSSGKQIQLPDLRCRAIIGMDGMGSTLTNRLAGITWGAGDAGKVGSYAGAATGVLTEAMLPAHNHTLHETPHTHTATIPAHNHTWSGYSDSIGSHSHNVTTYSENASHVHSIPSGGGSSTAGPGSTSTFATMAGTTTGGQSANHQHTGYTDAQGVHQHVITGTVGTQPLATATVGAQSTGITIDPVGAGAAHALLQPSYGLCFFMKL